MDIEGANERPGFIDYRQRGDAVLLHQVYGLGGEFAGTDGLAGVGHDVAHPRRMDVDPLIERATQITVRVHADGLARSIDHDGHAEPFARNLQQAFGHAGVRADAWHGVAAAHDVGDAHQQPAAECAARMRAGEILGSETARLEQSDGQRIAHGERGRGARSRREIERTGFLGDTDVEMYARLAGEGGAGVAGKREQRHAEACDRCEQRKDFRGLAGVGECQYDVVAGDHAEIAVAGLGRMQEKRRRTGARQGRGDLATDVPGLAHAGDNYASEAFEAQSAGGGETGIDARLERSDPAALDGQRPPARGNESQGVGVGPMRRSVHEVA